MAFGVVPVFCARPGENHSTDMIAVFHGTPDPLWLCGYHASISTQPV